jgi:hypothetical protein
MIVAGVLLLLSNLGLLPEPSWDVLWRLWPVLLIALGIDTLFGRRSIGGAVIGGALILALIGGMLLLVFAAPRIPALVEWTRPAAWQTTHIEHPLEGIERAAVDIDWTSVPGRLSVLRDSPNLIEGDVAYQGDLIFDVRVRGDRADVRLDRNLGGAWFGLPGRQEGGRWDIGLSPRVPLELRLDAGSGRCDLDLSDMRVNDLDLDVGSGTVDLILPSGSSFETRIDGGSGALQITLPEDVGARVDLESGSGSFQPGERFRLVEGERHNDGVWETEGVRTAEHVIKLRIDQGSGAIRIR